MDVGDISLADRPGEDLVPFTGPDAEAVQSVSIASLHAADSPRVQAEDLDYVRMLAQVEENLPPIVVHRSTMRVIDGMHRIGAALLRGKDRIDVRFVDLPDEELFLLAVRLNAGHGLPLSPADRRAAAARILVSHPHWSDRAVAAVTGLAARTVRGIRGQHEIASSAPRTRIGRDGRRRPLSAAEGRRSAAELIKTDPCMPLRQIAKQAGISLGTAADVRDRVLRGENPIPGEGKAKVADMPKPAPDGHYGAELSELAAQRDTSKAMRMLFTDPSLRFTESGRELLRWLNSRMIGSQDWLALVDELPSHCAGTVAELARQCSDSWLGFAEQLERRHRVSA